MFHLIHQQITLVVAKLILIHNKLKVYIRKFEEFFLIMDIKIVKTSDILQISIDILIRKLKIINYVFECADKIAILTTKMKSIKKISLMI